MRRTSVTLNLPGRHNVQNALAAAAIGWQLGVEPLAIARALEKFQGIGRRFNLHGEKDFGTGKAWCWSTTTATIRPNSRPCSRPRARGWPERRLVVAFQPHRYTRTRDLLDEFAAVLSKSTPGADRSLCRRRSADRRCRCESAGARDPGPWSHRSGAGAECEGDCRCVLPDVLHDGDLLILMGAGDIGAVAQELAAQGFDGEQIEHDPDHARSTDFGRVAVLMGGTSSGTRGVAGLGPQRAGGLRARGVDARPVDGIPALVEALVTKRFDRVFNVSCTATRAVARTACCKACSKRLRVPYTGSDVLGSALSMDKIRTKQVWLALGPADAALRAPAARRERCDVHAAARELGLPVIVKPACEGSSVGVSRVFAEDRSRRRGGTGGAISGRAADGATHPRPRERRWRVHRRHP
jgi:hypothetical protein